MPSKRHKKITDLFRAACEMAPDARASFLEEACAGDTKLQAEVEALLAQDKEHPSFLENVAPDKGQHARRPKKKAKDGVWPDSTKEIGHSQAPLSIAIEGYDIVRELQRGGQGVVYQAVQRSTKRKVAIKVLLEGPYASESAKKRFEREIELVAQLKHPNIIPIFHSGITPDGHHYYVMDYVRGQPLNHYVRNAKPTLEEALALFGKVCDAISYAHKEGVIHRDLKPSNILVDVEGEPRLLDFGLAKTVSGPVQTLVSVTGQIMGTLPYMSPEQTRGNPDEIDARSDVYSLGVILYELLTGTHPYPVKGEMYEVVKHITETEPTPPSKVWTADSGVSRRKSRRFRAGQCPIDNELQTIVFKALSKNRERRYQSAEALRQDISSYLRGDPIEAKRDSSLYVLRKTLRRHRTPIAVTLGFIVVTAAALFVGSRAGDPTKSLLGPSRAIPSLAILPFENLSSDPDTDYLSNEIPASIIDKLSGLSGLDVISRSGAFRFDPAKEDASRFGKTLGASVVLTGQLNARDTSLTIRIELVDVATNRQLWSKRYPCELSDIMALEAAITQNISEALRLQLTREEKTKLAKDDTENPEAYRAYIEARFLWNRRSEDGFDRAIRLFDQAISLDPQYARAYAGKADCYLMLALYYRPSEKLIPLAKQAINTALHLDDSMAEAYASLGWLTGIAEHEWGKAEEAFQRGISLNPRYATLHHWLQGILTAQSRFDEALSAMKRANEIDPNSLIIRTDLAGALYFAGSTREALAHLEATLEMDPDFFPAKRTYATMLMGSGQPQRAIRVLKELIASAGRIPITAGMLGVAYAQAGRITEARDELKTLTQLAKHDYVPALAFAFIHASLGNVDEAFRWLDKSYQDRELWFSLFNRHKAFYLMHGDPRFDDLLRRIGLEPNSESASTSGDSTKKTMLAVLPFANLSGDPEQEYFSDGMTEEMITRLGRLSPELLGVIARTSAMLYKKTDKTIDQIGRELGVAYVLEGGVRRSGNSVRINAQLIQVSDQTQLWGDSYTRDLSDVFAVQAEVAEAVAKALAVELLPQEESVQAKPPTESSAAYDAYLLGRSYWAKRTRESLYTAIDHFNRAIELDPTYALAYAGLADTWGVLPYYTTGPYQEMNAEASKAAEQAIALDDSLAEAHVSMALVSGNRADFTEAFELYRKAVELDPNNATAHQWYGFHLCIYGRADEGLVELEHGVALDPLSAVMHLDFANGYLASRRFGKAIDQFKKALALQPTLIQARHGLVWAYIGQGRTDDAAEAFEDYLRVCGLREADVSRFRLAYAESGFCDATTSWLASYQGKTEDVNLEAMRSVEFYAWCGNSDLAFELLDQAVANESLGVKLTPTRPSFEKLHSDPRWNVFLRNAGFPEIETADPSSTP